MVQRILNSTFSDHTKVSAAQMLFGKAITLNEGLFLTPIERPISDEPLSVHMSQLLSFQDEVMTKARDIFKESDDIHISSFHTLKPTAFLHGSHVLVKYRQGSAPTRLHTQWKRPLKVITNTGSEYILFDLINDKQKSYHVSDTKPFIFDPLKQIRQKSLEDTTWDFS
jgi:hypothetical protein